MEFTQRKAEMKAWAERVYDGKIIPISGEPYFTHISFVAELAGAKIALGLRPAFAMIWWKMSSLQHKNLKNYCRSCHIVTARSGLSSVPW